jgi:TP901 family phage tail tape measure protein
MTMATKGNGLDGGTIQVTMDIVPVINSAKLRKSMGSVIAKSLDKESKTVDDAANVVGKKIHTALSAVNRVVENEDKKILKSFNDLMKHTSTGTVKTLKMQTKHFEEFKAIAEGLGKAGEGYKKFFNILKTADTTEQAFGNLSSSLRKRAGEAESLRKVYSEYEKLPAVTKKAAKELAEFDKLLLKKGKSENLLDKSPAQLARARNNVGILKEQVSVLGRLVKAHKDLNNVVPQSLLSQYGVLSKQSGRLSSGLSDAALAAARVRAESRAAAKVETASKKAAKEAAAKSKARKAAEQYQDLYNHKTASQKEAARNRMWDQALAMNAARDQSAVIARRKKLEKDAETASKKAVRDAETARKRSEANSRALIKKDVMLSTGRDVVRGLGGVNRFDASGVAGLSSFHRGEAKKYLQGRQGIIAEQVSKSSSGIATSGQAAELKKISEAMNALSASSTKAAKPVSAIGGLLRNFMRYAMGYGALYAVVNGITSLISSVVELDKELRSIQALTNSTDAQMRSLGDSINRVALKTKFGTGEIAKAAKVIAQAGVATEDLPGVLDAVASFASGTDSALSTASEIFTTMRNVFKDISDTQIADQLTNAVNISKLNADDLHTILSLSAQVADSYGLVSDQYLAAVTTLRNAGIKSSTVATGLRQAMLEVFNLDSNSLAAISQRYAEMGEFMDPVEVRARFFAYSQAANPLVSVLTELKRLGFGGEGMATLQRGFDIRAINVLAPLVKDLSKLSEDEARIGFGAAAAEAADTQMKSLSNTVDNLGGAITVLAAETSGGLVSALQEVAESATEAVEKLTELNRLRKADSGQGGGSEAAAYIIGGPALAAQVYLGKKAARALIGTDTTTQSAARYSGAADLGSRIGESKSRTESLSVNETMLRQMDALKAYQEFIGGFGKDGGQVASVLKTYINESVSRRKILLDQVKSATGKGGLTDALFFEYSQNLNSLEGYNKGLVASLAQERAKAREDILAGGDDEPLSLLYREMIEGNEEVKQVLDGTITDQIRVFQILTKFYEGFGPRVNDLGVVVDKLSGRTGSLVEAQTLQAEQLVSALDATVQGYENDPKANEDDYKAALDDFMLRAEELPLEILLKVLEAEWGKLRGTKTGDVLDLAGVKARSLAVGRQTTAASEFVSSHGSSAIDNARQKVAAATAAGTNSLTASQLSLFDQITSDPSFLSGVAGTEGAFTSKGVIDKTSDAGRKLTSIVQLFESIGQLTADYPFKDFEASPDIEAGIRRAGLLADTLQTFGGNFEEILDATKSMQGLEESQIRGEIAYYQGELAKTLQHGGQLAASKEDLKRLEEGKRDAEIDLQELMLKQGKQTTDVYEDQIGKLNDKFEKDLEEMTDPSKAGGIAASYLSSVSGQKSSMTSNLSSLGFNDEQISGIIDNLGFFKDAVGMAAEAAQDLADKQAKLVDAAFESAIAEVNRNKSTYTGTVEGDAARSASGLQFTRGETSSFMQQEIARVSGGLSLSESRAAALKLSNSGSKEGIDLLRKAEDDVQALRTELAKLNAEYDSLNTNIYEQLDLAVGKQGLEQMRIAIENSGYNLKDYGRNVREHVVSAWDEATTSMADAILASEDLSDSIRATIHEFANNMFRTTVKTIANDALLMLTGGEKAGTNKPSEAAAEQGQTFGQAVGGVAKRLLGGSGSATGTMNVTAEVVNVNGSSGGGDAGEKAGKVIADKVNEGNTGLFSKMGDWLADISDGFTSFLSSAFTGLLSGGTGEYKEGKEFLKIVGKATLDTFMGGMGGGGGGGGGAGGGFFSGLFGGGSSSAPASGSVSTISNASAGTTSSGGSFLGAPVFARGGIVKGPGTSTSDSIPARLSNGEAVLNKRAVDALGTQFIHAANRGSMKSFAVGGLVNRSTHVSQPSHMQGSSNSGTVGTGNVTVMNVFDESVLEDYMNSRNGNRTLINRMKKNDLI